MDKFPKLLGGHPTMDLSPNLLDDYENMMKGQPTMNALTSLMEEYQQTRGNPSPTNDPVAKLLKDTQHLQSKGQPTFDQFSKLLQDSRQSIEDHQKNSKDPLFNVLEDYQQQKSKGQPNMDLLSKLFELYPQPKHDSMKPSFLEDMVSPELVELSNNRVQDAKNKKLDSRLINPADLQIIIYTNKSGVLDCCRQIEYGSNGFMSFEKKFFPGACYSCGALEKLKRCSGCQLVGYCSKNCQVTDWKTHKGLCKMYPVEMGKNVLERKLDFNANEIAFDYATKAERSTKYLNLMKVLHTSVLMTDRIPSFFLNARICNICCEPRPEMLFECRCKAVSHCKAHLKQDEAHTVLDCDPLHGCVMANWYYQMHNQELRIPDGLLNEVNLNEGLKFEKVSKLPKFSNEKWLETIVNLITEHIATPLTIHHVLTKLKLGEQKKDLTNVTSLTIHIVQQKPMLDPRMWEFFLHQFPKLKKLNLTFISNGMQLFNKYNSLLPVKRCAECKKKNRVITYTIMPKHYHEYFATDDYVEPDVVAVVGIDEEFVYTKVKSDPAHNFTSQRNMTYSKNTVVILTGYLQQHLEDCVKSFHEARTIKTLLPVQKNPICEFSTRRCTNYVYYPNSNVCCIQGNH